MRIAIFDYATVPAYGKGKYNLRLLRGLCREHEFTVFSTIFENPAPEQIRWVHVPCPRKPLALLFVSFHLLAPLFYLAHRLRHRVRFDLVQIAESNLIIGDISIAAFCHRAYLREHWKHAGFTGSRAFFRWLDYKLHSLAEPLTYRRVRRIVAASEGLARELGTEYSFIVPKIRVLNPADLERMTPPADFDRQRERESMGVAPGDIVFVFVALGSYEPKGLPLILDALAQLPVERTRLLVVGGPPDTREDYKARAVRAGLGGRVRFFATQRDVRPYFWSADALVLPSLYEASSNVTFEAAAAGLPVLVTRLNGVEEFLVDGKSGILITERSPDGVRQTIERFLRMSVEERRAMGVQAQEAVSQFSTSRFIATWRGFYKELSDRGGDPQEEGLGKRPCEQMASRP